MKKMYVALPMPLFLSGCMMLGMGGMGAAGGGGVHGAPHGPSTSGQTLVKESVVNGIRMTAEFPSYLLGDELAYTVTLRDVRDKSTISDASIALIVTLDDNQSSRSGQAGSHSEHGDSSPTQSQGKAGHMKVSPDEIGNGTYVFRPAIKNGGAYKFVFVLARVGSVRIDPPIEVEHTVQLDGQRDQRSRHGDHRTESRMAPAVLIGAGAMAIMMFFMFR